jgi:prepilin-type N-terminal cleavage/methylation domain-containing protein
MKVFMKTESILHNSRGFTLLEMIIVMGVFTIVIAIAGKSFEMVVTQMGKISRSEESNIESVVALEVFRRDLTQVGFGLFTAVDNSGTTSTPFTYSEVGSLGSAYNDATAGIPRAVVAGKPTTGVLAGTDYLALKGTTLSTNNVAQKWTYIDGLGTYKVWGSNDLASSDNVIAIRQTYKNGVLNRTLINDPSNATPFSTTHGAGYASPYIPPSPSVQYFYYGIKDGAVPKRPFNRIDYLVKQVAGSVPASCSPDSGVLYRSMLNHDTNGTFTDYPILDCVADMQVVFGWNTSGITNTVDYWTNADASAASGSSTPTFPVDMSDPAYIRQHLKLIKVYLLAQDGGKDRNFTNTNSSFIVGDEITKTVNLKTANKINYRWKVHKIVVSPKNLN